jgi:hypothetical protein
MADNPTRSMTTQGSSTQIDLGSFAVTAPPKWQIASLILVGPPDSPKGPGGPAGMQGNFQQNLVVVSELIEKTETLQSYVQKQTSKLQQQGALHRPPGPMEKVNLGEGREAVLFEHVVLGPSGEKVRQMQLMTLRSGMLHALIASHLDGLPFEAQRESFRSMLKSAKLP